MHTAWLSGDDVAHINAVTLRQAWLVLRWVTMSGSLPCVGHLSRYVTSSPGQLSLAISSWVGAMSTNQPKGGDAMQLGSEGRYGSRVGGRLNCVIPLLHTGHI